MKVKTLKLIIDNKVYMKIIYSVDSVIYNINVYERMAEHVYKEVLPEEIDSSLRKKIESDEGIQDCDKSEIISFIEDLTNSEKGIEKEFLDYIEKLDNGVEVLQFENFMGIKSAFIRKESHEIFEAVRLITDENMKLGQIIELPQSIAFYQILNFVIKQSLFDNKMHFIQTAKNGFYGIRTEGKYIYIAEFVFDFDNSTINCNFVVPVKLVKDVAKIVEVTPEMKPVIDKNVKTLINKLLDLLNLVAE